MYFLAFGFSFSFFCCCCFFAVVVFAVVVFVVVVETVFYFFFGKVFPLVYLFSVLSVGEINK